MKAHKEPAWATKIYNAMEGSIYADMVEEWEEDKEARTICFTLYDGRGFVVDEKLNSWFADEPVQVMSLDERSEIDD